MRLLKTHLLGCCSDVTVLSCSDTVFPMSKHGNVNVPLHLPFTASGEESPSALWLLWCKSRNIFLQSSKVIPLLCFQSQVEISDPEGIRTAVKGISLFFSGNRQKLNARDGSCPKLQCCPGLSWHAVLPCLLLLTWVLQAIHQPASFLKWRDCSRTSLIDTAQP